MPNWSRALAASAWLLPCAARAELDLVLDTPVPGAVIGSAEGGAFVSGRALARGGDAGRFDVVIVIDRSYSTSAPSGADVDGDGVLGRSWGEDYVPFLSWLFRVPSSDRGDHVLAAEVAAAAALVDQLDPRTTRVGVVSFSGGGRRRALDAESELALTHDFRKVHHALGRILEEGPHGQTNIAAAMTRALGEVLGVPSAQSEPRDGVQRVVLFMTDGQPNLPARWSSRENARLAIEAAQRAARAGVRVDTFAIGSRALEDPLVTVEMARVSDGLFTAVEDPRTLVAVFEDVRFVDVSGVEVRNLTTGGAAGMLVVDPDGSFSAAVDLVPGENVLEVRASSTDHGEAVRRVPVRLLAGAAAQPLPARVEARRERMLERRLAELRARRLALEGERDGAIRRALELEIEQTRSRAADERSRRELVVEIEEPRERDRARRGGGNQSGAEASTPE
jgi:hypothetical protein